MARTRILTQLLFASICAAVATISKTSTPQMADMLTFPAGIPDQTSSTTTTYVYTAGPSQSAVSYSYTYTYTTATTHWHAPRFPRATPLPPCTNDICPSHNKKRCVDSEGAVYGVLCDALLSGTVITNSGKFVKRHEVKRSCEYASAMVYAFADMLIVRHWNFRRLYCVL